MSLFVHLGDGKAQDALPLTDSDTFYENCMMLLKRAVHELGPAAQTLGAIKIHAGPSRKSATFAKIDLLAETARLPRRTVQRHLLTLVDNAWIENRGREFLRGGRMKRRTCTFVLTEKTLTCHHRFPLPWWLADADLTWGEKLLLCYLASQQHQKEYIEEGEGEAIGCSEGREAMTNREIIRHTGLDRKTFLAARDRLLDLEVITFGVGYDDDLDTGRLLLNPDVGVLVEPEQIPSGSRNVTLSSRKSVTGKVAHQCGKSSAPVGNSGAPVLGKVAHQVGKVALLKYRNLLREPSSLIRTSEGNQLSEHASLADSALHAADIVRSIRISEEQDAWKVTELCQKLGISPGEECRYLWTIAAWLRTGQISEAVVQSARVGTQTNSTISTIGFFRTHIRTAVGPELHDRLEKATKPPKGFAGNVPALKPCIPEPVEFAKMLTEQAQTEVEPRPKITPEQQREGYRKLVAGMTGSEKLNLGSVSEETDQ